MDQVTEQSSGRGVDVSLGRRTVCRAAS